MALNGLSDLQFGFRRATPIILQNEASECALACLAMISHFHGLVVDLPTIRRSYPISLQGVNLSHVIAISGAMGFVTRALRVELHELNELKIPCILHWDLNHFVVLAKVSGNGATINDPSAGRRYLTFQQLSLHFTGVALELSPAPEFKPKKLSARLDLRGLVGRINGFWGKLAQIILLAIVLEALALITPLMSQWVVDQAIVSADRDLLLTLALGFAIILLCQVFLSSFRGWIVLITSAAINIQWLLNVYKHLLSLAPAFFEKRHVGDILSRFNGINAIQSTITNAFAEGAIDSLLVVGTFCAMLAYSPKLTAVSTVLVIVYFLVRVATYSGLRMSSEREVIFSAEQQSLFLETIRGIQAIKHLNRVAERMGKWYTGLIRQKNASLRSQRLLLISRSSNQFLFGVDAIVVLYLGADLVIQGAMTVGMLFAFAAYKAQFVARISSLIDKIFELRLMQVQTSRLSDIVLEPPEIFAGTVDANSVRPIVEFRNVSFRYAEYLPYVLKDVSFKVEQAEAVALIGPSGTGKSTLLKLLLRTLQPTSGEILIGGVPISHFSATSYSSLVGAILQGDQLLTGSVVQNITLFSETADMERVYECAKSASVHADILGFAMGYETLLGDMGTSLSEGQKQRLLIARALFFVPKILLLDEATSNLDIGNERTVLAKIAKLNITRLVVAHRRETIKSTDRQIALDRLVSPDANT